MMTYNITILEGDGIGPEVIRQATSVLDTIAKVYGFTVNKNYALIGGCAIDVTGTPISDDTIKLCKQSDAVLLGAVGGPKWDNLEIRPEAGLLKLRSELGVFANLRPAIVYSALSKASPLKDDILKKGLDILIIRELTGGIYFGKCGSGEKNNIRYAYDTEEYSEPEIIRIAHTAFKMAQKRKGKLCSIDKANVMQSSKLWRAVVSNVAKEYPDIDLSHMYVDNAAMQLVRAPYQFDTIVTNNIFGDILSDEASQITGSIGMLPSASLGDGNFGLYEPIHGSAPDIAGKNLANPIAMILSVAMMLKYSLANDEAARKIEKAIDNVLSKGIRTIDITDSSNSYVTTEEMGESIIEELYSVMR